MSLAELSMRYRPVVLTLVSLLTIWGCVTFFTMPRREDPEFTIRVCVVTTTWPGAPAETVEQLVTDKIEQELVGIEEVKTVTSTARSGQSTASSQADQSDQAPLSQLLRLWPNRAGRHGSACSPRSTQTSGSSQSHSVQRPSSQRRSALPRSFRTHVLV